VIRIKSIFLKLFITYIVIIFVSHLVLDITYYVLFQRNPTHMHQHSGPNQFHMYMLGLASIISIAVTALFAYYLSKRITAPLREMNRVALHIAKGQFERRVKIKTHDELGELGQTFNDMAYIVQELQQQGEGTCTAKTYQAGYSVDCRIQSRPPRRHVTKRIFCTLSVLVCRGTPCHV